MESDLGSDINPGSAARIDPCVRCIVHIDADAFFASIEQRDHPEYRGKPVIVGHDPKGRGVVSTCSYEARSFGVKSAMPVSTAYRLCPKGIFVPPDIQKYSRVSKEMFAIMERRSPVVEKTSIDEGYLDVTGEDGREIARKIKEDVKKELGITVTAGVSYCKYLAKLASDAAKPDGLLVIAPKDALPFLDSLPVSRLPGIGPKTTRRLEEEGVTRISDLREMPITWFQYVFGKMATRMLDLCNGKDSEPVVTSWEPKSVSEETTFEEDVPSKDSLYPILATLTQDVAFRLRRSNLKAKTLGIKIRFKDFSLITREMSLPSGVWQDQVIYLTLKSLLERINLSQPVRLLGVFARNFGSDKANQPLLIPEEPSCRFSQISSAESLSSAQGSDKRSWDSLYRSLDQLRAKHGKPVVKLGATLRQDEDGTTGRAPR